MNLNTGSSYAFPATLLSSCPANAFTTRLTDAKYTKNVLEIKGLAAASLRVDTCNQLGSKWDSLTTLLRCNAAVTACACYSNDDGCGNGNAGDRTAAVPFSGTYRWFIVVYAWSSSTSNGKYQITLTT
jgi:hypothetical protein